MVIQGYRPPHSLSEKKQCDALMLGYLIKGLKALSLWPLPATPDEVHSSVDQLFTGLRSFECTMLNSDHRECMFVNTFGKSIDRIEKYLMPSGIGVDDSHRRHMKEQSKK